jgi:hypothetical protein
MRHFLAIILDFNQVIQIVMCAHCQSERVATALGPILFIVNFSKNNPFSRLSHHIQFHSHSHIVAYNPKMHPISNPALQQQRDNQQQAYPANFCFRLRGWLLGILMIF